MLNAPIATTGDQSRGSKPPVKITGNGQTTPTTLPSIRSRICARAEREIEKRPYAAKIGRQPFLRFCCSNRNVSGTDHRERPADPDHPSVNEEPDLRAPKQRKRLQLGYLNAAICIRHLALSSAESYLFLLRSTCSTQRAPGVTTGNGHTARPAPFRRSKTESERARNSTMQI